MPFLLLLLLLSYFLYFLKMLDIFFVSSVFCLVKIVDKVVFPLDNVVWY